MGKVYIKKGQSYHRRFYENYIVNLKYKNRFPEECVKLAKTLFFSNFPLQKWESIKNINLLDSCSFSWSNVQQENFKSLYSIMYRLFSCIYSFWSWISISMATLRCTFYTVSFIFQWWKGTLWIIYNNQLFRKIEELLRILFKDSYYLLEARAWAAGYEKPSNRSPSNIEFAGDLNTNSNFRF